MEIVSNILKNLASGNSSEMRKAVRSALECNIPYQIILTEMLKKMDDVGEKFKNNIIFVPEVLIIGRAFNVALEEMQPYIEKESITIGTVVIGTVYGDYHDIGKNLVKLFLVSSNIRVIDLGINVSTQAFIDAIKEYNPDFVALSALLTTTMIEMEKVITKIEELKLRDNLKIIIGGAPVTESFAENIGADYYRQDGYAAAQLMKNYFLQKK